MMKKRDYPTVALETKKILKIVESISRFGGSASREQVSKDTGIEMGIGLIIASAKQYGLIKREEGSVNLTLTPLGKAYCLGTDDGKKAAVIRAILTVPYYKRLVSEKDFYKEPSLSVLKQIFINYGIPEKDAGFVAGVFRRNLSEWKITFQQLKQSEGIMEDLGLEEAVGLDTLQVVESSKPLPTPRIDNVVSGVKLAWTISYLKYKHKDLDSQSLLKILDGMLAQASSFKELSREIEATQKFARYSDASGISAYIKDHFENALAKDLGIENFSDLIGVEKKKEKTKQEEKSIEGDDKS